MQNLGLETFSLFSGSTVKNPNFSEFHLISLMHRLILKVKYLRNKSSDLHEILRGGQLLSCELK